MLGRKRKKAIHIRTPGHGPSQPRRRRPITPASRELREDNRRIRASLIRRNPRFLKVSRFSARPQQIDQRIHSRTAHTLPIEDQEPRLSDKTKKLGTRNDAQIHSKHTKLKNEAPRLRITS